MHDKGTESENNIKNKANVIGMLHLSAIIM